MVIHIQKQFVFLKNKFKNNLLENLINKIFIQKKTNFLNHFSKIYCVKNIRVIVFFVQIFVTTINYQWFILINISKINNKKFLFVRITLKIRSDPLVQ